MSGVEMSGVEMSGVELSGIEMFNPRKKKANIVDFAETSF